VRLVARPVVTAVLVSAEDRDDDGRREDDDSEQLAQRGGDMHGQKVKASSAVHPPDTTGGRESVGAAG
jgi:hypothetical protein